MDRLESLTNTLSNITLYDIKSMYTQAKNVVLNVSEMEAKVREATNEDAWGASSSLMQEIAQGTFHFQYFNEIMPSIYSRFMEKEARQWRQIYKALQLLEYLIKHGSERVVDDSRSHISTLKMLRNFHYIDEKGKDEGVNVRNRARELVELLSDVEKIRLERRKAKANKNKYVGVGSDGMGFGSMSFESSGGGRYGDSFPSAYSNGGGSTSQTGDRSSFSDNRRQYEEYNAGEDEMPHSPARSNVPRNTARKSSTPATTVAPPLKAEVDLLGGFDDDTQPPTAHNNVGFSTNKALPVVTNSINLDDDDFADFQAAPVQATRMTAPAAPVKQATLSDILAAPTPGLTAPSINAIPQQQQTMRYGIGITTQGGGMGASGHRPAQSLSARPMQFTSLAAQAPMQNLFAGNATQSRPTPVASGSSFSPTFTSSATPTATKPSTPAAKGSSNFDDLWNLSLGSKPANAAGAVPARSIKDLEKEKTMAGLWGSGSGVQQRVGGVATAQPGFNSFGNASTAGDDLLL